MSLKILNISVTSLVETFHFLSANVHGNKSVTVQYKCLQSVYVPSDIKAAESWADHHSLI